jgi:predicted metal-dependent hydrolase
MDGSMPPTQQIVPRKGPDFGLNGDIPRHWFGGDPFKTRFFDAMSLLFPEGEKFFIQCVRDYRDRITDPQMQADVKDFIYQEGQHGMVHDAYNRRVAAQGVAVDHIEARMLKMLAFQRRNFSRKMTLAQTAAAEHMTAIMAHSFMADREMFAPADPRMRALYVWHAIEEIEHKSVAFDVMQKVAKIGYGWRMLGMLYLSIVFPLHTFLIMAHMLRVDGVKNRFRTWMRGLAWLYGPRGVMTKLLPHYLAYFKPGFHPWSEGQMATYTTWRQVFDQSDDAIAAANALHPA